MEKRLLRKEEVAELLGVSPRSVSSMVYHRRIPAVQISKKCLRFDPAAIEAWLKAKSTQTQTQMPQTQKRPRGRPRKDVLVDRLVEQARQEVLK